MEKIGNRLGNLLRKAAEKMRAHGFLSLYIPRWIVCCVDLTVVAIAFLTVALLYQLVLGFVPGTPLLWRMALALVVYGGMEYAFRIYRGTIRYSGLSEIVRLFTFSFIGMAVLLVVTALLYPLAPALCSSSLWIILHSIAVFVMLFVVRVAIKYIFYFLSVTGNTQERVFIFGSDANALSLAKMFSTDVLSNYKPVALLDISVMHKGMRLGSIPVIQVPQKVDSLKQMVKQYHAHTILIYAESLNHLPTSLIDDLLSAGLHLMMVGEMVEVNTTDKKRKVHIQDIRIEDLLNRDEIHTSTLQVKPLHMNQTVLVTGAAGSIGSEIVLQVAAYEPKLLILMDQAETPLYEMEMKIKEQFPQVKCLIFIGDVRNRVRMEDLFSRYRPDLVYHAAAYKHVPMMERYPAEAIRVNVMGTRIVADLAVKYHARKFVMISTDKAVNPTNVMGASKRIAEIYVQSLFLSGTHQTQFITTRFGNVLGSNGSVVPLFKSQIAKGGPVTVTHKDIIRYFMTIPEACRLVLDAATLGCGGEIFIFDMGKPVRIYDMAQRMIRLSGLIPNVDIQIVETGLRPGEKLYEELLNDQEKTLETPHPKIKVAKVRKYDYETVCAALDQLVAIANGDQDLETVRLMKRIVPEFKSKNSIYEKLDVAVESTPSPLAEVMKN